MDNRQEKLSLLQELIALSKVDANESFLEEDFIYTIASMLNVPAFELTELKNNPIEYHPENKETDRIVQFYRLLLLMEVDQINDEKEVEFCKEAGLKMGLNPHGINTTIEQIIKSETGTMNPEDVIKIFQTYHN